MDTKSLDVKERNAKKLRFSWEVIMPKQPADIPKSLRIKMVRELINECGLIDKKTLTARVSQRLRCEEKLISRALYRDLEELVRNKEIEVEYYERSGERIPEYDPAEHKNVECKWRGFNSDVKINGVGLINRMDGQIWADPLYIPSISIGKGNSDTTPRTRHIYLGIGTHYICIKTSLSDDSLPFSYHFARVREVKIEKSEVDIIQATLNKKRMAYVRMPASGLSAFKDTDHLGHFTITILENDLVEIMDLNSSNGTIVYQLTMADAETIRLNSELIGYETVTESWNALKVATYKRTDLKPMSGQKFSTPIVIQCCEGFRILVI